MFAEESYEVTSCGEFWLECLGRIAEQAPVGERDSLRLTHNDLRTVGDDQALADRCIGSLLDFADRHQKRLLLLVENLNMLFSDMGDPDAGWRLRKTLQTEPRIILLGSATSRFEEIDNSEHALYDLFRVITLRPLDTEECEVLWTTVSGKPSMTGAVRPLEILTGGNPRLLTIIARFGAGQSFRELMGNLLDLVDEHTEYFKSHLESLPPQERRVYLALARLWKPATAKEVADLARVDVNGCSALLKRLVQRGAVTIEGGTPRRRQYYLTERLYNIYYLLRRGGGTDRWVKALIDFMVCLYSPSELENKAKKSRVPSVRLPSVAERPAAEYQSDGTAADALIFKAISLDQMDPAISESEFSLLLKHLAEAEELRPGSIEALKCVVGRVGSARSLELIQESPAAKLLLPLVTALQQELGQSTQVAKELDEVAGDIRVELRGRIRSGEPALRGKLTVTNPRE